MRRFEFGDLGSPLSSTPVSVADVVVASTAAASLLLTGSMSVANTAAALRGDVEGCIL